MKYEKVLEKELKEANETIGALVSCVEQLLDGDERFKDIARTVINGVRSKCGDKDETDSQ